MVYPLFCWNGHANACSGLYEGNRCMVGWLRILFAFFPAQSSLPPCSLRRVPPLSVVPRRVTLGHSVIQSTMVPHSTRLPRALHAASTEPAGCESRLLLGKRKDWGSLRKNPPLRPWSAARGRSAHPPIYISAALASTGALDRTVCRRTTLQRPLGLVGTFEDNPNSFTECEAAEVVGGGAGNAFCLLGCGKRVQRALSPGQAQEDVSDRSDTSTRASKLHCTTRCVPMYVCVRRGFPRRCSGFDKIHATDPGVPVKGQGNRADESGSLPLSLPSCSANRTFTPRP